MTKSVDPAPVWPIATLPLEIQDDVVHARRCARVLAGELGFGNQDQTRVATALSEIARNAFGYAGGGKVEFLLAGQVERCFVMRVHDRGAGIADLASVMEGRYASSTGMGLGITGARRLMDRFEIETSPSGTVVMLGKVMSRSVVPSAALVATLAAAVRALRSSGSGAAIRDENRDLIESLASLAEREEEAQRLNLELEDTNRGVVALHAELERQAEELRRAGETLEWQVADRTRALEASVKQFRGSFDASPDYLHLFRVDHEGVVRYEDLNPAASARFGQRREDVSGRRPSEVFEPATCETIVRCCEACCAKGEVQRYEAVRTLGPDASVTLSVWAAPIGTTEAGERLIMFCGRDITAQRQAEEALRQSQKMEAVGQLTGGIAHDFNNLLTGVVGALDLIQRRLKQGRHDKLDTYIELALASANRAAALTHRLLAFARRQPLDPKIVDVNALIGGMDNLLRRTIDESITLSLALDPGAWTTLCDPFQLENAILNLAINARDAMPDGGRIVVSTRNETIAAEGPTHAAPGDYVVASVVDTGTGMPPEVVARAFDPFFTTKPLGQGTGLGLSMIYGFARQSEGVAHITSKPGQGTTIDILLPRHEGAVLPAGPVAKVASARGRGETVLLVEDDGAVRNLVNDALVDAGYKVMLARDGLEGLAVAIEGAPRLDLLVTDVGLPGLNGRQLADAVRETRPTLKVLFITGYAESAASPTGFLDTGMAILTKPFVLDVLLARVRELLDG